MQSMLVLLFASVAVPAIPQSGQAPAARQEEPDHGGFWPTRRMTDLLLTRWAEHVVERYELDEAQSVELTRKLKSRWSGYLNDNESSLKPLLNSFVEMRLQMEPPSKEQVQEWGRRASQAFNSFETQIKKGSDELRGLLRDDQLAKFEGDLLGFTTGMQFARTQLHRWEQGEYEEREFWDPPLAVRRARREAEEARARESKAAAEAADAASGAANRAPADQIVAEMDAWQKYVDDFIKQYQLDAAQKKAAYSILEELRQRALSHRDANKVEIDKLEARIARHSGTDEQLAKIKEDLDRLYGPIDAMFAELQKRLEPIPTATQKAAAKTNPQPKPPDSEPVPKPRDTEKTPAPRP